MATKYVSANGLRFAYLEQGSGPLVLMLHGFPDNAHTYRAQMKAFSEAGYRVVCPFLRGYAPSDIPSNRACDPATLAKDVEALIRALGSGEKAYLIGMDWGGTSTQAALVTCPDLIAAAVVMNAAHPATLARFAVDPAQVRAVFHFWFFQSEVAPEALAASDLQMVDFLWKLWSPDLAVPDHLISVKETLATPGVLPVALRYYPDLFAAARKRTFPIGPIAVPTLSIFGQNDPTAKYSDLEAPFFTGPYRKHVLPGVGHWPHLERETAFNAMVLDWFQTHGRRTL